MKPDEEEQPEEKAGRGRPAGSGRYTKKTSMYFDADTESLLKKLATRLKVSEAGVVRQAVQQLAKREGVE